MPDEDLTPEGYPAERDVEAPEDAFDQDVPANPAEDQDDEVHRGLEVNEYDAVEQAHAVNLDDEY